MNPAAQAHPFAHYVLLLWGVLSNCMALKLGYGRITFLLRSRKVYGKVVGSKEVARVGVPAGTRRSTDYYLEAEFEASDGSKHRVTANVGSNSPSGRREGSPILVRYDPRNPDDASIDNFVNLWLPTLAFLFMGVVATYASYDTRHLR